MEGKLNIRVNWKHVALEHQIRKYDSNQDVSRTAILQRMLEAAEGRENWNDVKLLLSKVEKNMEAPVFTNFQAKYDAETFNKLEKVRAKISFDLKDSIKILQQQYMLQLIMYNYLNDLKHKALEIGNRAKVEEITIPDMVKIIVEMILLDKDSVSLKQIKEILVKWKNEN